MTISEMHVPALPVFAPGFRALAPVEKYCRATMTGKERRRMRTRRR